MSKLPPMTYEEHLDEVATLLTELFDAEDLFWSRYLLDGDAGKLGAAWAGFARAAIFPTLAAGLAGGTADPRAAAFVDALESAVAARLAGEPEQMTIPLAAIVLAKRPKSA